MPYSRLHVACKVKASTNTLRRALKATGYCRCVACRRPFINKKQAAKRVAFCKKNIAGGASSNGIAFFRVMKLALKLESGGGYISRVGPRRRTVRRVFN